MLIEKESLVVLRNALVRLEEGFTDLPEHSPSVDLEALQRVMVEVANRMKDNFPYPHPMYCGQMLKPSHPIARPAYALALWINPNNHALDGGSASSVMEKEAVAEITSKISSFSKGLFEESAAQGLHFAIANLPASLLKHQWSGIEWDQDDVTCLRSCLMKPEHFDWIERIWQTLDKATKRVLHQQCKC